MSDEQQDRGGALVRDPQGAAEEVAPPRASKGLEIAAAIVILAFFAVYLVLGTQIELRRESVAGQIDARTWPLVLGTAGIAAAVLLLVSSIVRPAAARSDLQSTSPGGPLRVVVTVAITGAFIAIWSVGSIVALGYRIELFPIAAAIFMVALMLVFGQRRWVGLVVYPVALTAFVYLLFGMALRIPL